MRELIVKEVEQFRRMVRPSTASASTTMMNTDQLAARTQLPVPSRDDIMSSPGAAAHREMAMNHEGEIPSDELERELMYGRANGLMS
jgi:hypothetical protein